MSSERPLGAASPHRLVHLCLVAGVCGLLASPAGALTIDFERQTVRISAATAGGEVVLVAAIHETANYATAVSRVIETLRDDDGDGVVTYEHDRPISIKSRWLAIDLADVSAALAVPDELANVSIQPLALRRDNATSDRVATVDAAHLILVRPGRGAWTQFVVDGGINDADSTEDREVALDPDAFSQLAGTAEAVDDLAPKDHVFALDPHNLTVTHMTVASDDRN